LPEVYPENEDAVLVYTWIAGQAIYAGMDGIPVDPNFHTINLIMDMLDIENRKECFMRTVKLWREINTLKILKKKNK